MSLALAFKISEVESDPALMKGATKDCYFCDPDNPRAVPQEICTSCGGTGRQGFAAVEIAEELRASKSEASAGDEDDLYLDY